MSDIKTTKSKAAASASARTSTSTSHTFTVTVDTDPSDVLKYDQQGSLLDFKIEPGVFLKNLPIDVFNSLTPDNRNRYVLADQSHDYLKKRLDEERVGSLDWLNDVAVGLEASKASRRLSVKLPPGRVGYWSDPEKLPEKLAAGYRITPTDGAESIVRDKDGSHTIRKLGRVELVHVDGDENEIKAKRELKHKQAKAKQEGSSTDMDYSTEEIERIMRLQR